MKRIVAILFLSSTAMWLRAGQESVQHSTSAKSLFGDLSQLVHAKPISEKYSDLIHFLEHAYINKINRIELPNFGANKYVLSMSPSSPTLAIVPARNCPSKGELIIWNLEKREMRQRILAPNPFVHALITPDDQTVITADDKHQLDMWKIDSGQKVCSTQEHHLNNMALNDDGSYLIAHTAHTVFVWDVQTGVNVFKFNTTHDLKDSSCAAINQYGRQVAVESEGWIYVFDTATGHEVSKFKPDAPYYRIQKFNFEGKKVCVYWVLGAEGKHIYCFGVWDIGDDKQIAGKYFGGVETYFIGTKKIRQKDNNALIHVRDDLRNYWLCSAQEPSHVQGSYAINDSWFVCPAVYGKRIYAWNLDELARSHVPEKLNDIKRKIVLTLGLCEEQHLALLGSIRLIAAIGMVRINEATMKDAYMFASLPYVIKDILQDYVTFE